MESAATAISGKQIDSAYGLAEDQPLSFEAIIRACYANPDREEAFPNFFPNYYNTNEMNKFKFCGTIDADTLIERIKTALPISALKFDQEAIRVHDTSKFYSNLDDNPEQFAINNSAYLEEVKSCRWFGPYKQEGRDRFDFYSINRDGSNNHYVHLGVWIDDGMAKVIYLCYWNRCYILRDNHNFYEP